MGKYALVASYYDKWNSRFINEKVIKIEGINLSNLQDIDKFTSSMSEDILWNRIDLENDVEGLNFLSIRYMENDYVRPVYDKVIIENEIIYSCCSDLESRYYGGKINKYAYAIDMGNIYFQKEKKELINLIENREFDTINDLFDNNKNNTKNLKFLIKRYMNMCDYYENDEQEDKYRDFSAILSEFSRYKTFRGWIIAKDKLKYKKKSYGNKVDIKQPRKKIKNKNKGKFESLDALYKEIDKETISKHGMSYAEWLCFKYNTRDLDKEEFLEPDELPEICYNSDLIESVENPYTKRLVNKN